MKQLFYTFRSLLQSKGNNIIKIISLTLGLVVALVLFSKVAFEVSYDTFYPDVDQLYRIQRSIQMSGDPVYDGPIINGPVPGAIKNDIAEVEDATVIYHSIDESTFSFNNMSYKEEVLYADSSFFDMFGYKLIEGDKRLLGLASNIFLSKTTADRIFPNGNAVGQTLHLKGTQLLPLTVAGVIEDIPENSHLKFDVVISFKTVTEVFGWKATSWMTNDLYIGYLKLRPGISPQEVEAKIPGILPNYFPVEEMRNAGAIIEYFLNPVKTIYSGEPTVKRLMLILSLLAFSLLFVSAMNYVLISISSLSTRAKSVGVHKCSGASNANIFSMFILETIALILIAIILSVVLIFAFQTRIEALMQTSLSSIFSLDNLWVTLIVIAVLIVIAGVIPATMFSAIPVTQVFRTSTTNKKNWKRILLLIQFAGISFMMTLLVVIVKQYDLLINKDLGYTVDNVVSAEGVNTTVEELSRLKNEFERIPQVAKVTITSNLPIDRANGIMVYDETGENQLFSGRNMYMDEDFLETFEIELLNGVNFVKSSPSQERVIVNESFVRSMHWTDSPIGKTITLGGSKLEVIGLVKDFQLMTLRDNSSAIFRDISPLIIFQHGSGNRYGGGRKLVMRTHQLDAPLLADLNNKLKELMNDSDVELITYRSRIDMAYEDAELFRDSILVASIIMLLITLLGLVGYTTDEINRRSKEIAIRKVNGAHAFDILKTISKDIAIISIPAIVVGLLVAFAVSREWLMQFAVKVPLSLWLFAASGLAVLAIIILCVVIRSWNVANDDPVHSLKSE